MKTLTATILSLSLLTACAVTPPKWQANTYYDEFTDQKACRVEYGTAYQRDFGRALMGTYFSHNFYAENNNGQIRAGVRSEPAIPINGDIQIKVGSKLYTLTSANTPMDVAPTIPAPQGSAEFNKAYADSVKVMQQFSSPYRAYTGQKAKTFLQDIVKTGGEIKFRVVGVNAALSGTGAFTVNDDFINSLKQCGLIK